MEGAVIWITGLAGSGKTTLAKTLASDLENSGCKPVLLDGDILREVLDKDSSSEYSREARLNKGLRYAKFCHLLSSQGFFVVISTISMFDEIYSWNRANLPNYFEVYLKVSLKELKRRDKNLLYSRFEAGLVSNVVGLDIQADEPQKADLVIEYESGQTHTALSTRLIKKLKTKGAI